jgi:hypothetical protein
VQRGSAWPLSRSQERNVYFPICHDHTKFTGEATRKLPGASRADIAIVRRYQPYHRRKGKHAFALLDELSNKDKHRYIRPVMVAPAMGEITLGKVRDCEVTRIPDWTTSVPIEVNAEIYRVYVRKTGPNPDVQMKPYLGIEPALEGGFPLTRWLQYVRFTAYQLLTEFSPAPRHHFDAFGITRFLDLPD